jgi:hypothetical protein
MNLIEEIKTEAKNCTGLIFRGYVTQYRGGNDGTTINERKGLKLLKRKSCNMCPSCGYDLDMIGEYLNDGLIDFSPIEDGKLYRVIMTNFGRDWETGIIDEWDYEIVEVKDEDTNSI